MCLNHHWFDSGCSRHANPELILPVTCIITLLAESDVDKSLKTTSNLGYVYVLMFSWLRPTWNACCQAHNTPLSDFSTAYMSGLYTTGLPWPTRLKSNGYRWDLPVLVHRVSAHARGLWLRRAGTWLAALRLMPYCLPPRCTGSAP